mmetsp:Transcript_78308/g.253646  ORF Transcript_78308/g.253646 Transcript_78308/m.253646 type:complete len:359 (-) Transcript_78308:101-1177(-)
MASAAGAAVPSALAEKLAALRPKKVGGFGLFGLQDPNNSSLRPYELSETLRPEVNRLSMMENLVDMQEKGYTVLKNCFAPEQCDELVEAVLRVGASNHMLRKGGEEVFDLTVVNDKMYALAEYMVGAGCQLSQLAATVNPQNRKHRGMPSAGLHSDQNWTPAPFPEHNQLLTCCIVLSDDFTLENGATCVVPGSHKLRRHPNQLEQQNCAELVEPIVAKRGDVACWDGSVWHAPGVRQNPGQRVVFHVTYCRVFMAPLENYDDIEDSTLDSKNYAERLRRLLGRGHEMRGLFNLRGPGRDMPQFARLTEMARGTYDRAVFDGKLIRAKKAIEAMMKSGKVGAKTNEALKDLPQVRSKL